LHCTPAHILVPTYTHTYTHINIHTHRIVTNVAVASVLETNPGVQGEENVAGAAGLFLVAGVGSRVRVSKTCVGMCKCGAMHTIRSWCTQGVEQLEMLNMANALMGRRRRLIHPVGWRMPPSTPEVLALPFRTSSMAA